jgi:hypothetical protein
MDDAQFLPAPGIAYRTLDGLSGRYFDCQTMRATLTPDACMRNFQASKVLGEGRYASCHRCKVGSAHAGEASGAELVNAGWRCCRCGPSGQSRIIGGTLCVSCYNRTREALNLSDGRGKIPKFIETVRPGWAVVGEVPKPEGEDPPRVFIRPLDAGLTVLAAVPSLFRVSSGRFLLTALVEGMEELQRTIRRKLPGVSVLSAGIEPSLQEFHEVGIDPNEWLRAGMS